MPAPPPNPAPARSVKRNGTNSLAPRPLASNASLAGPFLSTAALTASAESLFARHHHHAPAGFTLPDSARAGLALWLDAVHALWQLLHRARHAHHSVNNASTPVQHARSTVPPSSIKELDAASDQITVKRSEWTGMDDDDAALAHLLSEDGDHGGPDHAMAPGHDDPLFVGAGSSDPPETALEAGLVHATVRLIVVMTPSTESAVRTQAMSLIVQLAELLASEPSPPAKLGTTAAQLLAMHADDPRAGVDALLQVAGPPLALLAIAVVAGLAGYLTHRDAAVRAVTATAMTRLVLVHQATFEDADRLAVVAHLFFALTTTSSSAVGAGSGPGFTTFAGNDLRSGGRHDAIGGGGHGSGDAVADTRDRHVLISALGELIPIYKKSPELTGRIVDGLLKLEVKTKLERAKIQETLTKLSSKIDMGQALVLQVHPEDDDSLDLVWWGATTLARNAPFPGLLDVHVTSPQAVVRYGCALILDAHFRTHPDQLVDHADLLLLGYHDRSVTVASIYRRLLDSLNTDPASLLARCPNDKCPIDLLERVATSLDFLTLADKKKTLAFLDLWAARMPFNQLVYQSLLSLLPCAPLQTVVMSVLSKMAPVIASSSPAQLGLLWQHLRRLPALHAPLLPYFQSSPDFYPTLFHRILFGKASHRAEVYTYLRSTSHHRGWAVGILILALGDQDEGALHECTTSLQVHRPNWADTLRQLVHAQRSRAIVTQVKLWDDLASLAAQSGSLTDWLTRDKVFDLLWEYYLKDQPDHQVAPSPDDYMFAHALTHSPCWVGLLLHRLEVPPPPAPKTEARATVPTLATLRRRFFAGYMLVMFPLAGYPDVVIRRQACQALVACCFSSVLVVNSAAKALLEYVTLVFVNHKTWGYVCSALDMATMLVRTKVPNVAQYLVHHFLGTALDWAINNPHLPVRLSALQFLETCCLVFPVGLNARLAEVRDVVRQCCMDRDPPIAEAARAVWSCVFRILSDTNAPDYLQYVRYEMNLVMQAKQIHLAADPLLQNLSAEERKRLVRLHLEALGNVRHPSLAHAIVTHCLPLVTSASPAFRAASVQAILHQFPALKEADRHLAGWAILPLAADQAPSVAHVVSRHLVGQLTSLSDVLVAMVTPHADDATALPQALTLDEILDENKTLSIAQQNRVDAQTALASSHDAARSMGNLTHASRLDGISALVGRLTGWVPDSTMAQVLYYLERALDCVHLRSAAILVLAEFACMHESALDHVCTLLMDHLLRVEIDNDPVYRALERLSEHTASAFKHILGLLMHALNSQGPLNGVLHALRRLHRFLPEFAPAKIDPLLDLLVPGMASTRPVISTRLLVADLVVDLILLTAATSPEAHMARATTVYDAMLAILDRCSDAEDTTRVYAVLRRLTAVYAPPSFVHPLFTHLQARAMPAVLSPHVRERIAAIEVVACAFLPPIERRTCELVLVADEMTAVVQAAQKGLFMPGQTVSLSGIVKGMDAADVVRVVHLLLDHLQARSPTRSSSTIHGIGASKGRRGSRHGVDGLTRTSISIRAAAAEEAHLLSVIRNLYRALSKTESEGVIQSLLVHALNHAASSASKLRTQLFHDLHGSPLFTDEFADLPMAATLHAAMSTFATLRQGSWPPQSATAATPASPAASMPRLATEDVHERHLQTLTQVVGDRDRELAHHVRIQTALVAILGCTRTPSPDMLTVLAAQLRDDHRGVRAAAASALLQVPVPSDHRRELYTATVAQLRADCAAAQRGVLAMRYLPTVTDVAMAGTSSASEHLYHRKRTLLKLAVGLAMQGGDPNVVQDMVDLLVHYWRDPIWAVRRAAIQLVRQLLGGAAMTDAHRARLIEAMGALVSREDYPEKQELNDLLHWCILEGVGDVGGGVPAAP
ncbi:hypothetical protein AMAG_00597 [Allomyces macrogynus ATCC 38327]|uniref:Uncharacterized protein n=1 Tax=Allomyces macrogynus (strain ATCC 38327) TaxID=578462 RepID=A0A0L0RX56_ALLM3|nr:hypothetical protein AMAG_00597 [Allomyces macrogynus ATCC 38327]|eukprot:KNE54636.1 hypothetical protein AMAG_00597 [Allomyces macrogynus ATCC 38327]